MSQHALMLADRMRALPVGEVPPPWRVAAVRAVGGLCAIGFSADCEHLLVVSHAGRGVFNATTGKLLARDDEAYAGGHDDPLLWHGVGPIAGETIRTAGLWGGGLHVTTRDQWSVEVLWFDWPEGTVVLQPPGRHYAMPERGEVFKLRPIDSYRACGFSPDGLTFVVAESHTLTIYTRRPESTDP